MKTTLLVIVLIAALSILVKLCGLTPTLIILGITLLLNLLNWIENL